MPAARRRWRRTTAERVARHVVDQAIADGCSPADGDALRDPDRAAGLPPELLAAMDRLEAALDVAAPPSLSAAARRRRLPARRRERARGGRPHRPPRGRPRLVDRDVAASRRRGPRAGRDGAAHPGGVPRRDRHEPRYVLGILEDLDRRGILRRTDAGHVLGPKTLEKMRAHAAAAAETP